MSTSSSSSRPVRTSKGNTTMSKPVNGITAFRNLQTRQKRFVIALVSICGTPNTACSYTRDEVLRASTKCGMSGAPVWVTNEQSRRLGRGIYFIPELIDRWRAEGRFRDFIAWDRVEAYRGFGGMRNEEDFLITSTGARRLGKPKPLSIAEVEALRR